MFEQHRRQLLLRVGRESWMRGLEKYASAEDLVDDPIEAGAVAAGPLTVLDLAQEGDGLGEKAGSEEEGSGEGEERGAFRAS